MRAEQGDLSLIASPNIIRGEVASSYQKGRTEGRKEESRGGKRRSLARHRLPGSTLILTATDVDPNQVSRIFN